MKLLTKEIEKKMPALYATDGEDLGTRKVHLRLFSPVGQATWLLWEYNPMERMFFGLCFLTDPEMGYVSLDELEDVRLVGGLGIERDTSFKTKTLKEALQAEQCEAFQHWGRKMEIL